MNAAPSIRDKKVRHVHVGDVLSTDGYTISRIRFQSRLRDEYKLDATKDGHVKTVVLKGDDTLPIWSGR